MALEMWRLKFCGYLADSVVYVQFVILNLKTYVNPIRKVTVNFEVSEGVLIAEEKRVMIPILQAQIQKMLKPVNLEQQFQSKELY